MAGFARRCSASAPCIFCGNVGRCSVIEFPDTGDKVHWCHGTLKSGCDKGSIVTAQGVDYYCFDTKTNEVGTFNLWKKYLSKEEWIEEQKRLNPDWKPGKGSSNRSYGKRVELTEVSLSETGPIEDEEEVLAPEKLHEVYSYFLSLLVLEDKHSSSLKKEWTSTIHPRLGDDIFSRYPIKSLPPIDKARFANGESFKNMTRKAIMAKMVAKFGDLRGVPGFYMRGGEYYEGKPEAERWTFVAAEGMVFPCYDKDGNLYRIRYRDDYPNFKIKEGEHPAFDGKYGLFSHSYDKDGKHVWKFRPDGEEAYVVHSVTVKKMPLSKGLPAFPCKVEGKYKNFSSVSARMKNGKVVNAYKAGSRSGSPYSLFDKGCDSYKVFILTEGEKKSMVASAIKKMPLICVPGVSSFRKLFEEDEYGLCIIDYLVRKGMKYLVICYDADKNEKEEVKKAEAKLVEAAKAKNIKTFLGEWEGRMNKGLDDILIMGLDMSLVQV